ncbi:hypothetical protein BGX28_000557 [Mortierella sp. GBA30]|nr:hypothetical protein BGX28_000557 [Mortierella sp. GBA30]
MPHQLPHQQQQQQQHFRQEQYRHQPQPQQHQAPASLVINTKIVAPVTASVASAGPDTIQSSSTSSRKKPPQQTVTQLADFAAHMVCYLLYGQPSHRSHSQILTPGVGTPPSSIPSSPLTSQSHKASMCTCETCIHLDFYPTVRSTPSSASGYPSWQQQQPVGRKTHRRIMSESDIVQPKPMFRKFCLDVLSATLLSPSVILLSLKYIQQLMINLKESNKIVNTGDGAEYRFFTGALILANKFLDDNTFTNKTWADITGMKIKDVNHLEMQFLNGIDFRLFTSSAHYSEWLANLTQFTGAYMPSQHLVACQQQTSAAQSPVSPTDDTGMSTGLSSATPPQHVASSASGLYGSHSSAPTALSMASISNYIDSVKHLQQKASSASRFQRTATQLHHPHTLGLACELSQQQYVAPQQQTTYGEVYQRSPPSTMPFAYHQVSTEILRKRSANLAFEDVVDDLPCNEPQSLPHSVPTHKRFSSSSSTSTLMGLNPTQDMFQGGHSPVLLPHQRHHHRPQHSLELSHRASSGALSTSFKAQHQRSGSGSYFMDMRGVTASSSSFRDRSQVAMSMPSSFKQSGAVHPFDDMQEQYCNPELRSAACLTPQSMPRVIHPFDGQSCSPRHPHDKCGTRCQSMGYRANAGTCSSFEMDPHLWGPLDSLSLYAITTQAAKRVVAQGKALSASANGLHMYYPTTLA